MTINLNLICVFVLIYFSIVKSQAPVGSPCEIGGYNGTLTPFNRCMSVVSDLKRRSRPKVFGYIGIMPIVCCTDCELVNDTNMIISDRRGFHYFKTGQKAYDSLVGTSVAKKIQASRTFTTCPILDNGDCKVPETNITVPIIKDWTNCETPGCLYLLCYGDCLECMVNLNYSCRATRGHTRYYDHTQSCHRYRDHNISSVFGGKSAKRREYPHMALLGYGNELLSAQWDCGGSVISERFILTAGHCTSASRWGPVKYVALGILKRSDPPSLWQTYTVKNIIKHPLYESPIKYNDIALLEIDGMITFSHNVLPACLNTGGYDENIATATGWGHLGPGKSLADTLQFVKLNQYDNFYCFLQNSGNRLMRDGYNSSSQSCYGVRDAVGDTCRGDSGGPLQIRFPLKPCMRVIIGVTSSGSDCGSIGYAGLYTRISYFISWIESVVWP